MGQRPGQSLRSAGHRFGFSGLRQSRFPRRLHSSGPLQRLDPFQIKVDSAFVLLHQLICNLVWPLSVCNAAIYLLKQWLMSLINSDGRAG